MAAVFILYYESCKGWITILSMERDWMKVYTTNDQFKADILKGLLKEEGIKAVILNKQDSSYRVVGELELYTPVKDALEAINIIKNHNK